MQLDTLRRAVQDGTIDTVVAAFTDHYGRTMGKAPPRSSSTTWHSG